MTVSSSASGTNSNANNKVAICAGTRPEVIKLFSVYQALVAHPTLTPQTIAVQQQAQLLDQAFAALEWTPDVRITRTTQGFSLAETLGWLVATLGAQFQADPPCAVIVQGDTTTALAGALAGFYARIPVVHVEAGLRTWTLEQPFPEEMHRACIDQFASLCLAPTEGSKDNLIRMGIANDRIFVTGNTVVDALFYVSKNMKPQNAFPVPPGGKRVVVTCHRRENFAEGIASIARAVLRIVKQHPDVDVLVTRHPNPNVSAVVDQMLRGQARVQVLEPLSYRDFVHVMNDAWVLLTDSGGIQEEATALGKPVLILRDSTERPEAVGAGIVVGVDENAIVETFQSLVDDKQKRDAMAVPRTVFGDGHAGQRTVSLLSDLLKRSGPALVRA